MKKSTCQLREVNTLLSLQATFTLRGGSCFFFSLHVEQAYWTQALCKLQLVVGCLGTGSLDEDGLLFPWYHGEEIV